jgi:ABC-type nitrate/sulfonate/bicarbonate transport system substrate-binding protein
VPAALIKYLPHIIVAALVSALAVSGYFWAYNRGVTSERAKWDAANLEAAQRFQEALAAQQDSLLKLDAELRRARREKNEQREALGNAIASNPDWSTATIPSGVRAALERDRAMPADSDRTD